MVRCNSCDLPVVVIPTISAFTQTNIPDDILQDIAETDDTQETALPASLLLFSLIANAIN
jgi:hypothetical protein